MQRYIIRRALLLIPTVLLLGTLLFLMLRVMPGDVALALTAGEFGSFDPEEVERLRVELGLNDPLIVQYGRWFADIVRGDLGYSISEKRPVAEALFSKAEVTLSLAVLSILIAVLWALPLGIVAAVWRGSWADQLIRLITAGGLAIPGFWLGIVVLLLLVRIFHWSPPVQHVSFFEDPGTAFQRLIFPALVIGYRFAAVVARLTRSTMLEVINQDYVRTAKSKGLDSFVVVLRHALPNAYLPILTVSALLFGVLVEGAVVIEQIYALPGIGRQIIDSVNARDFIMVQGMVVALGVALMLWVLVIDILYAVLDPRVRYE